MFRGENYSSEVCTYYWRSHRRRVWFQFCQSRSQADLIISLKLTVWKYDTKIGFMGNMYCRKRPRDWCTGCWIASPCLRDDAMMIRDCRPQRSYISPMVFLLWIYSYWCELWRSKDTGFYEPAKPLSISSALLKIIILVCVSCIWTP